MARPKSADPAVKLNCTIPESLLDKVEAIRGDVHLSTWVKRAIEQRLEREAKK